jgi:predicted MFS family arabinose efflux permease
MAGVLPLVALTDRVPARTIYLACSALNALSCFGIALSDGLLSALVWRAVGGIALAGMYMPGLRALTDEMAGARRARAAAWYTSSFTLGSSLSFLLGQAGLLWGWRGAFLVSGALGGIGVLLAWAALPRMNAKPPTEWPRAMPDLFRVFGNRDVLVLIIGYAATIWGTAGLRQWIVVFLSFCVANQGSNATQDWSMLTIGALIGLLGVPAGLCGNELSLRFGLRATAMGVFLVSVLVNALFLRGARRRRALAERCDGGGVLLHRLCRWVPRHAAVWCGARSARRNGATSGLAGGIRHLRDCVPSRLHRNRIPAARCGAGIDARGRARQVVRTPR